MSRSSSIILQEKQNSMMVLKLLKEYYPTIQIALSFSNVWELLVATILSAQCTDKRVNIITSRLFKKLPHMDSYAQMDLSELENDIKSAGFFRNKARHIQNSAQIILQQHNGCVPNTMETLIKLPGVGRKTANVVLFNGFSKNEGIAVDTHVQRISQLLGLTQSKTPLDIEKDLMALYPRDEWGNMNHRLVQYGRDICVARSPRCNKCPLQKHCHYYQQSNK